MKTSELFEGEESSLRKTFDAAIEHEVTLREKYYAWNNKLNDYPSAKMNANWFLAQFDAMLAEDIEKMKSQKIDIEKYRLDLIEFNRCNKSNRRLNVQEKRKWNEAIGKSIFILEARRTSLKK